MSLSSHGGGEGGDGCEGGGDGNSPSHTSQVFMHFSFFINGGFILVSDYVRMEVTLVGASWVVVAGDQTGCGLHSFEVFEFCACHTDEPTNVRA